ncbi:MAG: 1-(5-phosphoribosyl)-5-amino-4-imidazole-carboxylate carboxylase, partial [Enterocloster citroniae]|nr:1-(5-phosphoribosyl)-5-amino-4-imidazole-carboxylate carboxylase [Enterocloster citroniae]
MDVRELLEKVKTGAVDIEDAQKVLKYLPYEYLGYAKLDHHRKLRYGFGETV